MTTKKKKTLQRPKKDIVFDITLTAVIPTEQYGNVQPSFTAHDVTPEQIENEVRPYVHSIFEEYRKKEVEAEEPIETITVAEDERSIPFKKALEALNAAKGDDAHKAVIAQIKKSTKLTKGEIKELLG